MKPYFFCFFTFFVLLLSCNPIEESTLHDDINQGGETSITGSFVKIFEQPAYNLSPAELDLHRLADKAFGDKFVSAPSLINGGLGPIFNQNSCESCHTSNGRSPFPDNGSDLRGLLFRISSNEIVSGSGPLALPNFGTQLQTKSTFGANAEASISWQLQTKIVEYIDGKMVKLSKPIFVLNDPYIILPQDFLVSPRIAPPVFDLGLVEAIDKNDILSYADEFDTNKDGISGKSNMVWNVKENEFQLGRFGLKAGHPTLLQQIAGAYNEDMGITNPLFRIENCLNQAQYDNRDDDAEIDSTTLQHATFYTQSLAVPTRRNYNDPDVIKGKNIFFSLKCGSCHRSTFVTGTHEEYGFLSKQTIFPYSDFLLHDMGDDLADNRPEYLANGKEWRTSPLWGLGLAKIVGGPKANYLHDGRATTIEEAILWHGGESAEIIENYKKFSAADRYALIKFLESL